MSYNYEHEMHSRHTELYIIIILSFVLLWGGTRSLRMPALRPAAQAGPMRKPSEETSVVIRNTVRLT